RDLGRVLVAEGDQAVAPAFRLGEVAHLSWGEATREAGGPFVVSLSEPAPGGGASQLLLSFAVRGGPTRADRLFMSPFPLRARLLGLLTLILLYTVAAAGQLLGQELPADSVEVPSRPVADS